MIFPLVNIAVGEPAVHDNGFVASTDLDFGHFKDDISHSLDLRAATGRCPVGDVELTQLSDLFGL